MSRKYDIVATLGKYKDAKGDEKNRYMKMGVVLTTSNGGLMIKIENIPVGWDGFAFLNEPKERPRDEPAPAPRQAPSLKDLKDDLPF